MTRRFGFSIVWSFFFCVSLFADVHINEVMYHPSSQSDAHDYIEIYNSGSDPVDLSGWSLDEGIEYTFPNNTSIAADGYLIVSASPAAFQKLYPTLNAIGPYQGRLNNDSEKIRLENNAGVRVDQIVYEDELGWPPEADGYGPSIERIHPAMPGTEGASWKAGPNGGTPGAKNRSALPLPVPIIKRVQHLPTVPKSTDSVTVFCQVLHTKRIQQVTLSYRREATTAYQNMQIDDDGSGVDQVSGDSIYSGSIPAQPNGTVMEFTLSVTDSDGQSTTFPANNQPPAIYRVDNGTYNAPSSLYTIVMRTADERTLRTRSAQSNDELPATFIHENDVYYNVGLRFRGKGSRGAEPKSYRINFSSVRRFGTVRKMNLNAVSPYRQYLGMKVFKLLRMPAPEARFTSLNFNSKFYPAYVEMERTDQEMMERLFGDGSGNLYRGIEQANFDYRGQNQSSYISNYMKITNEVENDYSDIVRLCAAFSNPPTPDDRFVEELSKVINIRQWIRWFAIKMILNDQEGGLSKERGDDYYIYRNPKDNLFYLMPWDLDSVIVRPFPALHHFDGTVLRNTIGRFLKHPDLANIYYEELVNILEKELTQPVMDSIIDETAPAASETQRNELKTISRELRTHVLSRIPRALTVQSYSLATQRLVREEENWRYLKGSQNLPSGWNQTDFNDSGWLQGPGGFGFSDNDDRTVLNDMANRYTSLFIRKSFEVADPSVVEKLILSVNYDDGFVAYLNGKELVRSNFDGTPRADSRSVTNHEAGAVEIFEILNPSGWLVPGKNTLAVAGFNVSLTSSDFSLIVNLDAMVQGGNAAEVQGSVDATRTRWIQVNGALIPFEPWTAAWKYPLNLQPGRNRIKVEALDIANNVVDTTEVIVQNGPTILDMDWSEEESPVVVDRTFVVPAGETLTIHPGVEVQMAPSSGIAVHGTLWVEGTTDKPVHIGAASSSQTWGGIAFINSGTTSRIQNAVIAQTNRFSYQGTTYANAVSIHGSTVEIDACRFSNVSGVGIDVVNSFLRLTRSELRSMTEMLHATNSFVHIEGNVFDTVTNGGDAIDLSGRMGGASIIRRNVIKNSTGDAVDTGEGAGPIVEANWIENAEDKGISLEGVSEPYVVNNVIIGCDSAVTLGDGCQATLAHNTFVNCKTGVVALEKNAGRGGGIADIINCVIWGTEQSVSVDAKSSVSIQHSDLMQLPDAHRETNMSVDPMFTDANSGQYSPQIGSPLIDAGVSANVNTDYNALPRPLGLAPDIGAFEVDAPTRVEEWMVIGE